MEELVKMDKEVAKVLNKLSRAKKIPGLKSKVISLEKELNYLLRKQKKRKEEIFNRREVTA